MARLRWSVDPRALAPVREIAAQIADRGRQLPHDDEAHDRLLRLLLDELTRSERGSVVVLEDLHWADSATLDFLRFMARRIQGTSAVFVVTYRKDEPAGQHVIRMCLVPLSPAGVEDLARDSVRSLATRIVVAAPKTTECPLPGVSAASALLQVHADAIGFRHELARLAVLDTIRSERTRALHAQKLDVHLRTGAVAAAFGPGIVKTGT